jgi:hypothetical protein
MSTTEAAQGVPLLCLSPLNTTTPRPMEGAEIYLLKHTVC